MNTRQEWGLLLLVILLALPALWSSDPKAASEPPPACPDPVEITSGDDHPQLICLAPGTPAERMRPAARALPPDCPAPKPVPPGTRITVERAGDGACRLTHHPMPGMRRILLGLTLDPNQATAADFEALPGIGPVLSQRIIEDRSRNGSFSSLDDLQRVRGIGPTTLERIAPFIAAPTGSGPPN